MQRCEPVGAVYGGKRLCTDCDRQYARYRIRAGKSVRFVDEYGRLWLGTRCGGCWTPVQVKPGPDVPSPLIDDVLDDIQVVHLAKRTCRNCKRPMDGDRWFNCRKCVAPGEENNTDDMDMSVGQRIKAQRQGRA